STRNELRRVAARGAGKGRRYGPCFKTLPTWGKLRSARLRSPNAERCCARFVTRVRSQGVPRARIETRPRSSGYLSMFRRLFLPKCSRLLKGNWTAIEDCRSVTDEASVTFFRG